MTTAAFIRERATAEHRSAARELATFLALFNDEALCHLVDALRRDLRSHEVLCVAVAAIRAMDRDDLPDLVAVLERLIPDPPAGWPDIPLLLDPDSLLADAELWAEAASPQERQIYALVLLSRMTAKERVDMVRLFDRRSAA